MSAVSLGAAASHPAVAVGPALLVALEEVRTLVLEAAPRQALEVVVAVVVVQFLAVEADGGVDAGVGAAAEGGFYAVVVHGAEGERRGKKDSEEY